MQLYYPTWEYTRSFELPDNRLNAQANIYAGENCAAFDAPVHDDIESITAVQDVLSHVSVDVAIANPENHYYNEAHGYGCIVGPYSHPYQGTKKKS